MSDATTTAKTRQTNRIPPTPSPSISAEHPATPGFPIFFKDIAEQHSDQAKESWHVLKTAAGEVADTFQTRYSGAVQESLDYTLALFGTAMANANSNLEFSASLMKARTPSEVVDVASTHARRQLELMLSQSRQFWSAAKKISAATGLPVGKDSKGS